GSRGDSCLVEAAYGAEGQIGRDLEVLHVGQFLDLVLGEGALTAHGHHTVGTTYVVQGAKGQGIDQVVHVAELPVLLVSLDGQEARCGEVAVDQAVQLRADQRCRTYHGDVQARMCASGPLDQRFDLGEITHETVAVVKDRRGVLGDRNRVVEGGAVDHGAGDQDDSGDPRGRGGGQHGLGGADVVVTAIGRPGLRRAVVGRVHQDMHALQAGAKPWAAHVRDTPAYTHQAASTTPSPPSRRVIRAGSHTSALRQVTPRRSANSLSMATISRGPVEPSGSANRCTRSRPTPEAAPVTATTVPVPPCGLCSG